MFRLVGPKTEGLRARMDGHDLLMQPVGQDGRKKRLHCEAAKLRAQGFGVRVNGRNGRLTLRVWKAA
jgi:ribosomal protein L34